MMPRITLSPFGDVAGQEARRDGVTDNEVTTQCLAATAAAQAVDASQGTARHIRGSARMGAMPPRPGDCREGAESVASPESRSGVWREPGHGARLRADGERSLSLPSKQGAACGVSGAEKAGGSDVERHAAAAAGDGKGRRVDGQFRTSVRGLHALAGSGPSIRTERIRTRSRPRLRPRGAARSGGAAPIPIPDDGLRRRLGGGQLALTRLPFR